MGLKAMIVLCILFGVGGFFGTKLLIAPTYTASTSIYLTPQISESGSLDYNSQMANSKLVTNAVNLLTQNNIMSEWVDVQKFRDIQAIHFHLDLNGKNVQEGCSSDMLYKVDEKH